MKIKGVIRTSPRIVVEGENCHGLYEGQGTNFVIRINTKVMCEYPNLFLRVLLHEILHLYLHIVEDYTKGKLNLTEGVQHKLMSKLVKAMTDRIAQRAVKVVKG